MIRTLIADDHPVVRHGLRLILSENPNIAVTAEAGDGREALHEIRRGSYDVALLDISMPGMIGLETFLILEGPLKAVPREQLEV